jgi:Cytochrome C oxidase, cbb3-type, subunit III
MRFTTVFLVAIAVAGFAPIVTSGAQSRPVRSVWSGIYSAAQARRGEELYRQRCSSCHGENLAGLLVEPRLPGVPDHTPELAGPTFNSNWNDLLLDDLVERIRISMPQDKPGSYRGQIMLTSWRIYSGSAGFRSAIET